MKRLLELVSLLVLRSNDCRPMRGGALPDMVCVDRQKSATDEARGEEFETIFPASSVSAQKTARLSAPRAVIELTSVSPPTPVTLDDGRWSWGEVAVATEKSKRDKILSDIFT